MKKIFTTLTLVCFSALVFAQTAFEKAKELYDNQYYAQAAEAYSKVLKKVDKEKTRAEVYAKIGNSYYYTQNFKDAETNYKKALDLKYNNAEFLMNYGELRMFNGDYNTAKMLFEKAKAADSKVEVLANARIQSCVSAIEKSEMPSITTHRNVEELNSKYNDYGISRFGDKYIVSTSRKLTEAEATDGKSGQGSSKLYLASDAGNKTFKMESKLPDDVFSTYNNGTFTYNEATKTGYFTLCNGLDGKGKTCKIYATQYSGSWGKAEELSFNSDLFNCSQPSVSVDGKWLYFSSDLEGGFGQKDLYKVQKFGTTWGTPVNLGKEVNSAGDDVFPVITGDTLLVFSSDGREGLGGWDLYQSRISKNIIYKAVWLDMPFNSTGDDFNLVYGKTQKEGYYCSNRMGGKGGDDIYAFSYDEKVKGFKGHVYDQSGNPLAGVKVNVTATDGSKKQLLTDNQGAFAFPEAEPGIGYDMRTAKEGYFASFHNITLIGAGDNVEEKSKQRNNIAITVQKMPAANEEVKIDNIYFEYDKADLTEPSKKELNFLIKILNENPEVNIFINAHSDEQGEEKYNLDLSNRRAQSVVDYLVMSGIDRSRLTSRGWGESNPMIKNAATEEQHAINRRTTFQLNTPKF